MKRIYNFEKVTKDNDLEDLRPAIWALGSEVVNQATGEIMLSRDNAFFAIDRIGSGGPTEEDPGIPVITDFSKARDLKVRALSLIGASHVSEIFNDDTQDDDEDLDKIHSQPDMTEVDDYNDAFKNSPYYVNPVTGKAKYEEAILQDGEDVRDLRKFMEMKDVFHDVFKDEKNFDVLMKASPEQLKAFIDSCSGDGKEELPSSNPSDAPSQ